MRYIRIPRTDLRPSVICLGGSVCDERSPLIACFDEYVEQGGNCLDTANMYGKWLPDGVNMHERIIGRWLRDKGPSFRNKLILCTKGGHPPVGQMDRHRLGKQDLAADLDESLKALGVETIDLYWLHRDDPARPVGELLTTLNEFAAQGKIRYFGVSNWRAPRMREAEAYARAHNMQGFVANQPLWSYARANQAAIDAKTMIAMDDDAFLFHKQTGLCVMPYSPNAKGYFKKRMYREPMADNCGPVFDNPENHRRLERLMKAAAEKSCSISQMALAYLLAQPFPVVPIVGFSSREQLLESMGAVDIAPDASVMSFLRGPEQLF